MIIDAFGNTVNNDGTPINTPLNGKLPDLSNETVSPSMISGGQSKNFQTGKSGWQITDLGDSEFNSGIYRGTLQAATIENSNGVVIMDGTGLVSSTQFSAAGLSGSPSQTTTSNSYVDVNGSQMNSFTLTRTTNVLLYFATQSSNDHSTSNGYYTNVKMVRVEDSSQYLYSISFGLAVLDFTSHIVEDQPTFEQSIITLGAGTYTFKLQFCRSLGGTAAITTFDLGYVILGT